MPPDERPDAYTPAGAAVFVNSTRTLHPAVRSTGFRTHGLRARSLGPSGDGGIAEDFLLNTRFVRGDRESEASIRGYFLDPGVVMTSLVGHDEADGPTTPLPAGLRLRRELGEAISHRRSVRRYTGDAIPLAGFATLLRAGAAVTGDGSAALSDGTRATIHFRTAPSGGGLYPVDLWAAVLRVDGVERGVYRYRPLEDSLEQVHGSDVLHRLLDAFAVPEELITLRRSAVVVLLIARPWRSMRKYGARGLRFVFIEAGAIAENVHLAVQGLGLGSVDCASIYDDEAHDVLGIDGLYETLIHAIVIGDPG